MLIDTHCHLDMLDYKKLHLDFNDVIAKAQAAGVEKILHISCYPQSFYKNFPLLKDFPQLYFTVGIHPLYVKEHHQELDQVAQIINNPLYRPQIIALGEMGLDAYYDKDIAAQLVVFRAQMQLAQQQQLPVVIHTRDAKLETLQVLREFPGVTGVIHCFTQDLDFAQQALEMGYYIGVGGVMTFNKSQALRDILVEIPLERILLETDAPYMTPVPYRGKENQPAYIKEIAKFVAIQKGITLAEVETATFNNFQKLFLQQLN